MVGRRKHPAKFRSLGKTDTNTFNEASYHNIVKTLVKNEQQCKENVLRYEKKIAGIEEHYGTVVKS